MSSSRGGPRHALDPNPKHHEAGEDAGDRDVREQELRDQNDPLERARRLRDYHARAGRCLYDQNVPAPTSAAASSFIPAIAPNTTAGVQCSDVIVIDIADLRPNAAMTIGGDQRVVPFSLNIPSVENANDAAALNELPSLTTSRRTAATKDSSGIAPTGSPCVHHVMRARRQLKTEALEINQSAPIDSHEVRALRDMVDAICKAARSRGLDAHDIDCTLSAGYYMFQLDGQKRRLTNGSYTVMLRINGGAHDDGPLAGMFE